MRERASKISPPKTMKPRSAEEVLDTKTRSGGEPPTEPDRRDRALERLLLLLNRGHRLAPFASSSLLKLDVALSLLGCLNLGRRSVCGTGS